MQPISVNTLEHSEELNPDLV